ncbi:monovalent cation/H(+) antiporter subunit G [Alcanivorax sp. CY1518]|uniref:Monovalent cation/H(+) antiporter subunit G n=1 Tax=Alcanivorax quisquiliarum TaxID=2933565 RepID=A0ABT0E8X7_9GAMM|nr:monovalent cation/H(+) antiporter subunit G [Alcanivorax quisquiliarum]MCK0538297.1 monovalent cation/H(+) antiporter subunit G [Alcanivorax quisquiliarum]
MITDLIAGLFMIAGTFLMFLAGLGLLRMPDLLMRMHATTKAGAMGIGLVMIGVALHFLEAGVTARVLIIVLFVMLTAPVAAHTIGRAGYFVGVPLWEGMLKDELKGRYDAETHTLASPPEHQNKEP